MLDSHGHLAAGGSTRGITGDRVAELALVYSPMIALLSCGESTFFGLDISRCILCAGVSGYTIFVVSFHYMFNRNDDGLNSHSKLMLKKSENRRRTMLQPNDTQSVTKGDCEDVLRKRMTPESAPCRGMG